MKAKSKQAAVLEVGAFDKLREINEPGRNDIVLELAGDYLTRVPEILQSIERSIQEGDHQVTQRFAHSLKSSSAMLGLTQMSKLCLTLECAAEIHKPRTSDLAALKRAAAEAREALLRALPSLAR